MKRYKPSVDDILRLEEKCSIEYSEVHKRFDEDEVFYELEFGGRLNLPDEYTRDRTVLPTARDVVDTAVDHTDITNARVFVNRKDVSNIADKEAEMMRKFYLGLIHRTNVESPISPWRVGAKHYWLHGVTYFKTLWDADRWSDKPIEKKGESEESYKNRLTEWQGQTELSVPIIIQAVNPRNVMPDPFHVEPQFVIEKHQRLVYNIKKNYPHWKNPRGKEIDEEVEWIEYWDEEYKCFLADQEPVLRVAVVPHKYGFLPYVPIESGLGNLSINTDLKMRYVGILRYMTDVLIAESRGFSVSDIVLRQEAWPWFTITGVNAAKVDEIKRYFGEGTPLPEGVKIENMPPNVPPDALYRHYAMSQDIIGQHGVTRSVRGLSETGVRSGADRRLLMSEGGAKFSYSAEAFKHGTAKVLINCAHLFKNVLPGNIRLWARTPTDDFDVIIKRDMMKEPFTCYVEFAPISEEDEYRRHDDLERQLQSGLLTKKAARRQMSNVNPLELEKEEQEEQIKQSPSLMQGIDQLVGGRLADAIAQRSAKEGTQLVSPPQDAPISPQTATQESIPGRMTPPITQAATPLQTTQNNLKQQRSQTPISPTQGRGGGGRRYA